MGQGEKLSPLRPEDRDSDYPGISHLKGSSLEGAQSWAALSDLGAEHIWPPWAPFQFEFSCDPWLVNAH